jgi:hypothetical protein
MTRTEEKFAELLTQGVLRIRIAESKTVQAIQDELGYALGREGGTAVEYWRKGHIPTKMTEVETLAREIVKRGGLKRDWLAEFLAVADYPYLARLVEELFLDQNQINRPPASPEPRPASAPLDTEPFDSFIVGPPILSPRYFFGRDYELKRIFGLWRRFPLQNVAVIGQKRSGKTSLLHYLMNIAVTEPQDLRPGQKTDWLPQPERYRWVFVDFQDARMLSRERLLRHVLTCLGLPLPEPCDLANFMDVVSDSLTSPAIILMDEISAAIDSPELDQQFWGSLRSLGTNFTGGNLAFLLTSHEPPALLANERGKPSPFFNIFGHSLTLRPLPEQEARELIAHSPIQFTPEDVEWILAESAGWPWLLQILCHIRLTALEFGETGDAWKQQGIRQIAPYWYLIGTP